MRPLFVQMYFHLSDFLAAFAAPNNFLRSGVTALVALLASGYTMHPSIADTVRTWYLCGYGP